MTRLIDKDALLEAMNNFYTDEYFIGAKAVKNVITNAPTIQREGWVNLTDMQITNICKNLMRSNT